MKISAYSSVSIKSIIKLPSSKQILFAFLVCSSQIFAIYGEASKRYISEFTLDEITNADSNYQPINFNHFSGSYKGVQQIPTTGRLSQYGSLDGERSVVPQMNAKRHVTAGGAGPVASVRTKSCPPTKPFLCPSDDPNGGECIPIQYLCDGSPDCPGSDNQAFDENSFMCVAAKRPPIDETANFLKTLVENHGTQYIAKLFGPRMKELLEPIGGPNQVAVALSVSKTIEDFGKALHLMRADIDHLRNVLVAVQTMDGPMLKNLGIVRNSELTDMKFFLEKLLSTGFLD